VLSYPGPAPHPSVWPDLVAKYATSADYSRTMLVLTDPEAAGFTHFHLPPMTTVIAVLSRSATGAVDAIWLFAGLAAAVQIYTVAMPLMFIRDWGAKIALAAVVMLAWPNLFMLARGNLFAGLTCALVLNALLVLPRRPLLAAALLAAACNIRPNAIVFALAALALDWPNLRRFAIVLALTGLGLFGASLVAAHALYPDYSLASFRAGLAAYNYAYVAGAGGISGGSALFMPLKLWLGYGPAMAISLALAALFALFAFLNRHCQRSVVAFFACASYAAITVVMGDYHLTVFAAVPILAMTDQRSKRVWLATVAAALILAPALYMDLAGYNTTVVLRPLLIVLSSCALAAISVPMRSHIDAAKLMPGV
jgi:hypothetical protein